MKAVGILKELCSSQDVGAAVADLVDACSDKNIATAIEVAMNETMESSQKSRYLVGELFAQLLKQHPLLVSVKEVVAA